MGVAKKWEPWSWDLRNTPQEPDDDEAGLDLLKQKLKEALQMGREIDTEAQEKKPPQPPADSTLAPRLPRPNT